MLRVDVRDLNKGPVRTDGEVAPDHPAFAELGVRLVDALRVSGVLHGSLDGNYVWKASLQGRVQGQCGRCLSNVVLDIAAVVEAIFSADPELESDPSVYPLTDPVLVVDVTDALREEVGLAAPAYPLCRDDCAGLCRRCGGDLNVGSCGCRTPEPD